MRLSEKEKLVFDIISSRVMTVSRYEEMRNYIQHGTITTYDHCIAVAYYSFWVSQRLRLRCNRKNLIRGAMLHDYYLYDWHIVDENHRWHGFFHPQKALNNAKSHYSLSVIEENIIESHMWPLTVTKVPKTREAIIVCAVDKWCSLLETLHLKYRVHVHEESRHLPWKQISA